MAVRTIATELTLGGEREFQDAMKGVNSNLKTLNAEMKAVASSFIGQEKSTEALTAANKQLQQIQEQQAAKIDALKRRYEALESATVKDTGAIDKARTAYLNATTQYNKTAAEIKKNEEQIKANTDAVIAAAEAEKEEAKAQEAARKEKEKYIPVTERASKGIDSLKNKLSDSISKIKEAARHVPVLGESIDILGKTANATGKSFSAIAKAAAGLTAAGVAAVGGVAAIGGAALQTLTGYATDAASRSKDAYDKANELAEKAREEALRGNEDAAMEYQRQADELIASIDEDYLRLGNSLDVLSKNSTAAKDALGKILLPALQELTDQGAALLQSFSLEMENAAGDTEKMGRIMADYLRQGIALLREQIPAFGQIAVELLEGLGAGLEENLPQMLDDILAILDYILTTLADHADELGSAAATIVTTLTKFLIEHAPDLIVGGAELILQIIAGLAQALPDLIAEFLSLPGKLLNAFQAADIDWSTLGHNIVAGIWDGFVNTFETVKGWIRNAVNGLFGDVETDQDINSPSKKWAKGIGKPMAQGVGVGFVDAMQDVSRDMQRAMGSAMPGADAMRFNASVDAGSAAAGTGGGSTSMGGVSIVINGYNVKDDDELAEILSYKLQQLLDRKEA